MADEALYANMQATMNQLMNMRLTAMQSLEAWLPHSPVDIDAPVYVELGDREFDSDDNTMPLEQFIGELRKLAGKAPKSAEVLIELGTSGYDGDEHATYEVGYWRAPNAKERAEREEANRKIAERAKAREEAAAAKEREEFERLKAKFGQGS